MSYNTELQGNNNELRNILDMINSLPEAGSGSSSKAIIDVGELPTEDIQEGCFYRLSCTDFYYTDTSSGVSEYADRWTCRCVDSLPENPEPVSKDMVNVYAYYNIQDGVVYGYVDELLASAADGVSVGWYTLEQLALAFDVSYIGVFMDHAVEGDDAHYILLTKSLHIYDNGWKELPYAYESEPEFDITWDGEIGDKLALDMSQLGYEEGLYFVKVSDEVPNIDELIGGAFLVHYYDGSAAYDDIIIEDNIQDSSYPGVYSVNDLIMVVHDSGALATALGIPSGIYTNGVYLWLQTGNGYVHRFCSRAKITKIDSKFVDITVDKILDEINRTDRYLPMDDKYDLPPTIQEDVRYSINAISPEEVDEKLDDYNRIVDVAVLPTENIDESAIYRTWSFRLYSTVTPYDYVNHYVVDALPEYGEPFASLYDDGVHFEIDHVYYNVSDGKAYGYVDNTLSQETGVTQGWCPIDFLLNKIPTLIGFGGYRSIRDVVNDSFTYVMLSNRSFVYRCGLWMTIQSVGVDGTGIRSEVFNDNDNVASGDYAHAEGRNTIASGDYAHAEGRNTIASSDGQHVQGKNNIEDSYSKYAHIVGNGGSDSKRSNAHTLDWEGNAWFQGNVYIGGTGQDDESKKLATEEFVTQKAQEAATTVKNELLNGAGEAYDTLHELGELIDENTDALDALKAVASGKAEKEHTHYAENIIVEAHDDFKDGNLIGILEQLIEMLERKASSKHNHDDKYVTKDDIQSYIDNSILGGEW